METMIDRFGRVLIPKSVRDDLGLKPGMHLRVEEGFHEILLKPIEEESPWMLKDKVLVFNGTPEGDLTRALEQQRQERITKVSRRGRKRA